MCYDYRLSLQSVGLVITLRNVKTTTSTHLGLLYTGACARCWAVTQSVSYVLQYFDLIYVCVCFKLFVDNTLVLLHCKCSKSFLKVHLKPKIDSTKAEKVVTAHMFVMALNLNISVIFLSFSPCSDFILLLNRFKQSLCHIINDDLHARHMPHSW